MVAHRADSMFAMLTSDWKARTSASRRPFEPNFPSGIPERESPESGRLHLTYLCLTCAWIVLDNADSGVSIGFVGSPNQQLTCHQNRMKFDPSRHQRMRPLLRCGDDIRLGNLVGPGTPMSMPAWSCAASAGKSNNSKSENSPEAQALSGGSSSRRQKLAILL